MITDHLHFDAAAQNLQRSLPKTQIMVKFGKYNSERGGFEK